MGRSRSLDPAFIQKNVESLSVIGGVYDILALTFEQDHIEILRPYRLDTGAKSALELIREQTNRPTHQHTEQRKTNAESNHPDEALVPVR